MKNGKGKCPLVLVEWVDSRKPTSEWERLEELDSQLICECVSVGFLLEDGKDKKVLSPNMADINNPENLQVSAIMTIPTISVKRIKKLRELK